MLVLKDSPDGQNSRRFRDGEGNKMADAFIYDHVRSPRGRGKADGSLHEVTALNLATQVLDAVRSRNALDTALVDVRGARLRRSDGRGPAATSRAAACDLRRLRQYVPGHPDQPLLPPPGSMR